MDIELSIVMPCLNEEETLEFCIKKALDSFERNRIIGEVVISDNGSTDRSVEIAQKMGARVVHQPLMGYGNALDRGIKEAYGKYVIMGDADDSYDFSEITEFVKLLREGNDLVMGTRLKGKILKGGMPWLHRYIGNPVLTGILNFLFKAGISDAHCGLRAFTKEAYKKMSLKTSGMEYASEMVIKSARLGLKIAEVPIIYHPDKRTRPPHLRTFRDGWRHLRFMLMYSPMYFFIMPGIIVFGSALVCSLFIALWNPSVLTVYSKLAIIFTSLLLMLFGFFMTNIGVYAKVFALTEGFESESKMLHVLFKYFKLETGLVAGVVVSIINIIVLLAGMILIGEGMIEKYRGGIFLMFSFTLLIIGVQLIFSSFFLSMLGITRGKYRGDYDRKRV